MLFLPSQLSDIIKFVKVFPLSIVLALCNREMFKSYKLEINEI